MQKFISVGIDIGSQQHRIAVMNPERQILTEWSVMHRHADFIQACEQIKSLAVEHNLPLVVGMEGYNGYASPFDQYLISQGISVKQVNNLTLNRYRLLFGQPYKTDAYDAKLIASYLLQPFDLKNAGYQENLVKSACPQSGELKLISRHQIELIVEQTRYKNKLRKQLLGYFPEIFDLYKSPFSPNCLALIALGKTPTQLMSMSLKKLKDVKAQGGKRGLGLDKANQLKRLLENYPANNGLADTASIVAANYAKRIITLEQEIHQLDLKSADLLKAHLHGQLLLSVPGIGGKLASRIIGETINTSRFASLDKYCAYSGVICLKDDSGQRVNQAKVSKKVNHILKDAFMKTALTSLRVNPESAAYYQRKRNAGHNHLSALKCLAHQICKVAYKLMISNSMYQQSFKKTA